jgi:acyl-CoA thioesterase II
VRDLGVDTTIAGSDGRYRATLAEGWEIWGPQGGYVAAVALRGAAAASGFERPASFVCHFLRPAQVGPVDVRVETLRQTKRAESLRVAVIQNDLQVLEALVWMVAELVGVDHVGSSPPQVPEPAQLQPWETYLPGGQAPFPFWSNFDIRPVAPLPTEWEQVNEPRSVGWMRLHLRPALEDPLIDAARLLVAADSAMYPAAILAHEELFPYIAPSLDLQLTFHRGCSESDWLLIEATSPVSEGALVGGNASIWSSDGRLLASATQQMLQRT